MNVQHGLIATVDSEAPPTVFLDDNLILSDVTVLNATANASAGFRLQPSGQAQKNLYQGAGWETLSGQWLTAGSGADYEMLATLVSGTNPTTGTMGSRVSLGTSREFRNDATRIVNGITTVTSVIDIAIYLGSAPTPIIVGRQTLTATAIRETG